MLTSINFSILTFCTLPNSQLLLHAPSCRWKSILPCPCLPQSAPRVVPQLCKADWGDNWW